MAADFLQKQRRGRGRPFQKGQSGNPAGRQPGCRNRASLAAEGLLEGEAEALTRKAIELALEGDTTALRLCLERIVPQRKSRAVAFDLPPIDRVEDLAGAIGTILREVAGGRLCLDEGAALVGMLESQRRAMETIDLEKRLQALEAQGPAMAPTRQKRAPTLVKGNPVLLRFRHGDQSGEIGRSVEERAVEARADDDEAVILAREMRAHPQRPVVRSLAAGNLRYLRLKFLAASLIVQFCPDTV